MVFSERKEESHETHNSNEKEEGRRGFFFFFGDMFIERDFFSMYLHIYACVDMPIEMSRWMSAVVLSLR
ncbi:hypothetical protein CSUI_004131 [Cystoisospora suis]|uniref:Uncharacterized protein n=1 Tax=Cystoisospora suis TaxID=483139 RepID=A0A2C6KCZ0_9APIC|nr:hypothetical protein CSUI_004131 [Cystoisospora suis]